MQFTKEFQSELIEAVEKINERIASRYQWNERSVKSSLLKIELLPSIQFTNVRGATVILMIPCHNQWINMILWDSSNDDREVLTSGEYESWTTFFRRKRKLLMTALESSTFC